jgi:phage tail sheath protein FI
MAANFLHGVETIEVQQGPRPVQVVKSSVIALVGIAPSGVKNEPTLILSPRDAAQFGEKVPGFTIPQALDAIFQQGPATVIVVNTFDATTNTATETLETKTITNGKIKLAYAPIGTVNVFESNGTTPSDLVKDVDYTLDAFGNFTAISGEAAEGTVLKFTYKRLDSGTVTSAQIVGTINNSTGVYTGIKTFELIYSLFGFTPKVLIAPGFTTLSSVATELIAAAEKYRAFCLIDAPVGTTVSQAIAGRGPAGSIAGFNSSNKRAILCYPHVKVYDVATDSNINQPLSQFAAGVISFTDLNEGYWFSPSNHEIKGIVGVERYITAGINNPNSEANILNEKGIVTVFNAFGTGIRLWGNRSAAFPSSTLPNNFINVQRVADILHESIELAMLPFIDKPINLATIDSITETVNQFIRVLIGRGALIDGNCTFNKDKNPEVQLAAGQIVFDLTFMPPTPAERITFDSFIDISLLKALTATV